MGAQFEWLLLATVKMFWVRTRFLGRNTTLFARRFVVWFAFTTPVMVWMALAAPGAPVSGVATAVLLAPIVTALVMLGVTLVVGVSRLFVVWMGAFPGLPSRLTGSLGIWFFDLLWRLEAGGEIGRRQREASKVGVEREQILKAQDELREALETGDVTLSASGVKVGGETYDSPRLRGGKLVGTRDGQEVEVGSARVVGKEVRVFDGSGHRMLEFDTTGGTPAGRLAAYPSRMTADAWRDIVKLSPPDTAPIHAGYGPFADTIAVVGVGGVMFAVAALLMQIGILPPPGAGQVFAGAAAVADATRIAPDPEPRTASPGALVAVAASQGRESAGRLGGRPASAGAARLAAPAMAAAATAGLSPAGAGEVPGMVRVDAGTFKMGSGDGSPAERPAHRVTISKPFYLDVTEVTVAEYARCVSAGKCTPPSIHGPAASPADAERFAGMCNTDQPNRGDHPVNCVDHAQALAYCASQGKRLPTEAEWEYAARGSADRTYPWGEDPPACDHAVVGGCGRRVPHIAGTKPVGSFKNAASASGALDMAGNVWEWVDDAWRDTYASQADVTDPFSPVQHENAMSVGVLRGGSWDFGPAQLKAFARLKFNRASGHVSTGIRCARTG